MQDRSGAAVVNVASISGWDPRLAMSGQYGAAKAALIFDTERWALDFIPHGMVNTVSPGSILVPENEWDRYRLSNQAYFELRETRLSHGRGGHRRASPRCHRLSRLGQGVVRQSEAHHPHRLHEVCVEHGSPLIVGAIGDACASSCSQVIDEYVDAAERLDGSVDQMGRPSRTCPGPPRCGRTA